LFVRVSVSHVLFLSVSLFVVSICFVLYNLFLVLVSLVVSAINCL